MTEITLDFTAVHTRHWDMVDDRVRPIIGYLPFHSDIRIIRYDDSDTGLLQGTELGLLSAAVLDMNIIISHMRELDCAGRPLEASFAALYLGPDLSLQMRMLGRHAVSTRHWFRNLAADDYLTQPLNLEQMCIV